MELETISMKLKELCCRREYCSKTVFDKALSWGCTTAEARKLVDSLVEQKFVDDRRFTEAYVKDKLRFNKWGRVKIAGMLRMYGIDRNIATDVMSEIDETDYNNVLNVELQKKYKSGLRGNIFEVKGKLFRFATSRGFEPETVNAAISNLAFKK